jgi:hypothetical protein
MTALSSIVMASTGQTSTHAPHEIQVSSSTTAGIGGGNKQSFLTFSPTLKIGNMFFKSKDLYYPEIVIFSCW